MKKTMLALVAATLAFAGSSAFAGPKIEKPLWDCALTFKAAGGGIQVIVGHFALSGPGEISCVDIAGNTEVLPVTVTIKAAPVAANVALGYFQMQGLATGVGVATGPAALLGNYVTVSAEGALVLGAAANLSLKGGREALTMDLGVGLTEGFGVQLGLNQLTITARK